MLADLLQEQPFLFFLLMIIPASLVSAAIQWVLLGRFLNNDESR
jgi:hypothetical protein